MAVFRCKMCGANLNIEPDEVVVVCDYCDTKQTVPMLDSEKKTNLYNRANRLRMGSEFDKAAGLYESIIAEFPEEAEAYWGLCLCNYGIEYVDDPATAKKVPTCHRASFEKLANDENFKLAIEYSDVVSQKVYRDEAREIDRIMEEILSLSRNEKPYDVFICYKETDDVGSRTVDSVLAQDIYDALTAKGLRVFFSRISLEDKLGQMYEPYIFAALNSAKVMLCVGTKYEHFHAVWVKNEWSRFLKLMAKDKSKMLVPCYKDMDAYDLPEEFKMLQAQDMGKIGFMQDLVRGVQKILNDGKAEPQVVKETVVVPAAAAGSGTEPLLRRAFMFLEDGDWRSADEYCEKVLDIEPENAEAYLGKLMAKIGINKRENLDKTSIEFEIYPECQKAIRFASPELKAEIERCIATVKKRNEDKRIAEEKARAEAEAESAYNHAMGLARKSHPFSLFEALRGFEDLDYKDSAEQAEAVKEKLYEMACGYMKNGSESASAVVIFERLKEYNYKDSDKKYEEAKAIASQYKAKADAKKRKFIIIVSASAVALVMFLVLLFAVIIPSVKYNKALDLAESGEYEEAISMFVELDDYKDSQDRIKEIKYQQAVVLAEEGKYDEAKALFVELGEYKDSEEQIDEIKPIIYNEAVVALEKDHRIKAAMLFGTVSSYKDARERSFALWNDIAVRETVSAGQDHTVGLKSDGTVVAFGGNGNSQCNVDGWTDIVAVSTGIFHTVGLKSDGTVVAVGENGDGQCDVEDWTDIVAVSVGEDHTVGLKSDGTVVAVGNNATGRCDVDGWTNIKIPE